MLLPETTRVIGVFLLGVICAAAPFATSGAAILLIADMYVFAAGFLMASSIFSARRAGIDYMISFFFLFFIALPARVQISLELFPWFAKFQYSELALTFMLIAVSHLAYCGGQILADRRVRPRPPATGSFQTDLQLAKWAFAIILLSLIFAGAAGPGRLFQARFATGQADEGMGAQFLYIARSLSILAMVLPILLARFAQAPRLRRQMTLVALFYLPAFLSINYPPALARFVLFGVMIALSCCVLDFRRPVIKLTTFAFSVITLFAVFPAIKMLAKEGTKFSDVLAALEFRSLSLAMLNVDFDAFMQIGSTVQYYAQPDTGLRWGNNFLGTALFFVPRRLWPDKPLPTGHIISEELGYWYNNVASPLQAEALVGFGLLGPLIVFALLGMIVTRLEYPAQFFGSPATRSASFLAYVLGMSFAVILLRGALNAVAAQTMTGFYVCWAIHLVARRQSQSRSTGYALPSVTLGRRSAPPQSAGHSLRDRW